jgi:hypothetical protein
LPGSANVSASAEPPRSPAEAAPGSRRESTDPSPWIPSKARRLRPQGTHPSLRTLDPPQSSRRPTLLRRFLAAHRRLRFGARPQRLARRPGHRLELFPNRPRLPRRQPRHCRLPSADTTSPGPRSKRPAAGRSPRSTPLRPPCPRAEIPQALKRATRTRATCFLSSRGARRRADRPETPPALVPRSAATL